MAKKKEGLTARQKDYLRLMLLPYKDIQKALFVEESTVKTMLKLICKKLKTQKRHSAVIKAVKTGLIGIDEVYIND